MVQKLSEESVIRALFILEPIAKKKTYPDTLSSMVVDSHASIEIFETIYSMAFNVRLAFACSNIHNAQLYWDPINRWVLELEDQPMAFDPPPWFNFQGDTYLGQEGVRYQVVTNLENVDKWGQLC